MSKIQKIEFITIVLFILTFIFFLMEVLKDFNLFGESNISKIGIASGICSGILSLIFIVVYIIKIIKENNKLIKLLWSGFPIIAVVFTILFVNGVDSFNEEFLVLNIISIVLEVVMIVLYNIFFWYYYGKDKRPIITLVLYNMMVFYSSIAGIGIKYIHNYYLSVLIIAITVGYLELMICNKLKRVSDKDGRK